MCLSKKKTVDVTFFFFVVSNYKRLCVYLVTINLIHVSVGVCNKLTDTRRYNSRYSILSLSRSEGKIVVLTLQFV